MRGLWVAESGEGQGKARRRVVGEGGKGMLSSWSRLRGRKWKRTEEKSRREKEGERRRKRSTLGDEGTIYGRK